MSDINPKKLVQSAFSALWVIFIISYGIYSLIQDNQTQPTYQTSKSNPSVLADKTFNQIDKDALIVYVTRTGECYHRSNCSYLRHSKIPMRLSEAQNRFRPCSRCKPPP